MVPWGGDTHRFTTSEFSKKVTTKLKNYFVAAVEDWGKGDKPGAVKEFKKLPLAHLGDGEVVAKYNHPCLVPFFLPSKCWFVYTQWIASYSTALQSRK